MKLNPECIRNVLLDIEDKSTFDDPWEYFRDNFESNYLAEFSHEEIVYHIRQAELSGLLLTVDYYDSGDDILVSDLSPLGHEFLANVRSESIWKKALSKASGTSLPILLEVAKEVALNHFLK